MRVAVGKFRIETTDREQLTDPSCAPSAMALEAVDHDRLGDDFADLHARVERAVRVLKDDLNASPQRQQVLALGLGDIYAVEQDLTGGRPLEPQDAAACRGLAAAALADEPQGLAAADPKVDTVDGFDLTDLPVDDHSFGDREIHLQPLHLEEPLGRDL